MRSPSSSVGLSSLTFGEGSAKKNARCQLDCKYCKLGARDVDHCESDKEELVHVLSTSSLRE